MIVTPERLTIRAWLASWWPWKSHAKSVALEYAQAKEKLPDMMADLARFCCAFDTVAGDTAEQTMQNVGKHQVWIHIVEMANLQPEDIAHLQERTETNG